MISLLRNPESSCYTTKALLTIEFAFIRNWRNPYLLKDDAKVYFLNEKDQKVFGQKLWSKMCKDKAAEEQLQ